MAIAPTSAGSPKGNPADYQPVTGYSWFVLAMLCIVYVFNFLDRQLLSILTEPIKGELQLSDAQMGRLGGIYFAAFYTIIGIPVGWLADRTNRVRILALGCFLWSLCTFWSGRATTYPMLVAARMGVGIGEAGGAPPSYSIVADYFPAYRRGTALAIFSLGVPFGQALGIAFGAKIAELYDWRLAFVVLGGAGVVMSALLVFLVKEPKRGRMDVKLDIHMQEAPPVALEEEKAKLGETIKMFFGRPVLLWTALSCGAAGFVTYAVLNWTTPFLMRDKGMTLGEIALYYSILTLVFTGTGTWAAGAMVDKLATRSKVWYALVPAIALGAAIPFYLAFVMAPTWPIALAFLAGPAFLNIFYLAPALAIVQNSVRPNQRTISGALLLFVLNLVGLGFGPTFIGQLSTSLSAEFGKESLQQAMMWLTPFYVIVVVTHLVAAWSIKREQVNGIPSQAVMARNMSIVALVSGLAGLAAINVMNPPWAILYWILTLIFTALVLGGLWGLYLRKNPAQAA